MDSVTQQSVRCHLSDKFQVPKKIKAVDKILGNVLAFLGILSVVKNFMKNLEKFVTNL